MDLQTRKLRSFIAVAEELHFSRAAARLFIAQQALSKQIRELEDSVGVQLIRRSTRSVALTPAGEVFLVKVRESLAALDGAVEAAHRADRGETGTLKVGFFVGAALELTKPILDQFRTTHPDVELVLREFGLDTPSAGLTSGWADLALIRLPLAVPGLEIEPLFVEPRVVALASGHPLARRPSVDVDEILEMPVVVGASDDLVFQAFWTLADLRSTMSAATTIRTTSHTEEIELVAAGSACSITAASAARYTPHSGVRYVPIRGISGSTLAVGWRHDRRTTLVDQFLTVAREVRDRELALVHAIETQAG